MTSRRIFYALSLVYLSGIEQARAHLALVSMVGETNGLTTRGFGILEGTPRDGTARFPFQADTAVIREKDILDGSASVCGRTLMGPIDMKKAMEKAEDGGLPDVSPGGRIVINAHQVNADGGGPYSCAVDYTATGYNFNTIPMEMNLPGRNGRSDARAIDLQIIARMPTGTNCTGGSDGKSCLVRCLNGAKAGPFGGCMAFTQTTGLFDDPSQTGKGPSRTAVIDPITANPVTRDADQFSFAIEQLLQKAQNEPVVVMNIPKKIVPSNQVQKRQNNPKPNGQLDVTPPASRVPPVTNTKTPASTDFGTNITPGKSAPSSAKGKKRSIRLSARDPRYSAHVDPISPTQEGILFEISTGPLGQADVPQNVRQQKNNKRSLYSRQNIKPLSSEELSQNPTNPNNLTKEQILQAEKSDLTPPQAKAKGKARHKRSVSVSFPPLR